MSENEKNKKIWDPLSESLGIESDLGKEEQSNQIAVYEGNRRTEIDSDYELSRQTTIDTLMKASDALDELTGLARASQTPRIYEVLATLTSTILNGSKDLLELSKKKVEIEKLSGEETGPTTVNNNLILTTEGLQKMLEDNGVQTKTREIKNDE